MWLFGMKLNLWVLFWIFEWICDSWNSLERIWMICVIFMIIWNEIWIFEWFMGFMEFIKVKMNLEWHFEWFEWFEWLPNDNINCTDIRSVTCCATDSFGDSDLIDSVCNGVSEGWRNSTDQGYDASFCVNLGSTGW